MDNLDPFAFETPRQELYHLPECPVCREVIEDIVHDCEDDDYNDYMIGCDYEDINFYDNYDPREEY